MYKILLTCPPMLKQFKLFENLFKENNLKPETVETIQILNKDEIIEILPKYDGWILGDDPADREILKSGAEGSLKALVKWGVGTDNVDFHAAKELNLKVKNTPGIFGEEVSDVAMSYLLGLARQTYYIDREVRKGNWPKPAGISLTGKTLGIVGMGDIGRKLARKAKAFNLNIICWDPFVTNLPKYIKLEKDWPNGLEVCDFLVFACSLNENNHHMFSENVSEHIKRGLNIINVSRGPLIDEIFLDKLAKDKILGGIALDVFENEPPDTKNNYFSFSNSAFGSHNGSNTFEGVRNASELAIKYMGEFLNE